jgi:hypothetical protein
MKNVSQEAFLSIRVARPPRVQQTRIAAIIRTWDDGVEQVRQLLRATEAARKWCVVGQAA